MVIEVLLMVSRSIYAFVIGLVVWIRELRVFVIRLQQRLYAAAAFLLRGGNVLVDVEFHDLIDELRVLHVLSDFVFCIVFIFPIEWDLDGRSRSKQMEKKWENNNVKIES